MTFYSLSRPQVHANTHQIKCSWRENGDARRKLPARGTHLRRCLSENSDGGSWWKDIYCTQFNRVQQRTTGQFVKLPLSHLNSINVIVLIQIWVLYYVIFSRLLFLWNSFSKCYLYFVIFCIVSFSSSSHASLCFHQSNPGSRDLQLEGRMWTKKNDTGLEKRAIDQPIDVVHSSTLRLKLRKTTIDKKNIYLAGKNTELKNIEVNSSNKEF